MENIMQDSFVFSKIRNELENKLTILTLSGKFESLDIKICEKTIQEDMYVFSYEFSHGVKKGFASCELVNFVIRKNSSGERKYEIYLLIGRGLKQKVFSTLESFIVYIREELYENEDF